MDWILNNLTESMLIVGILLLVVEVAVLGFATFVLFFVGCAAVVTSGLLYTDIIPETIMSALLSAGILTALFAAVLWKPLKNLQTQVDTTKAKSDLIGHQFVLVEDVAPGVSPVYRYSGIDWQLKSEQQIVAGTKVEVTETTVGVFHIKAVLPELQN